MGGWWGSGLPYHWGYLSCHIQSLTVKAIELNKMGESNWCIDAYFLWSWSHLWVWCSNLNFRRCSLLWRLSGMMLLSNIIWTFDTIRSRNSCSPLMFKFVDSLILWYNILYVRTLLENCFRPRTLQIFYHKCTKPQWGMQE